MARSKARKFSPLLTGKKGVECAMTSVCLWSPRMKRSPMPRGSALPSVSGMTGIPVEFENRAHTGVLGLLKCGAIESFFASAVGVNVPLIISPFA